MVFAPQGLGGHVDHLQTIRAVVAGLADRARWYRDTPYAIRDPGAFPSPLLPAALREYAVTLTEEVLARKLDGCCAYRTQLGYQFGGPERLRTVLVSFARAEARRLGAAGHAEGLLSARHRYPLRGMPIRYDDPIPPVAEEDWDASR